MSKRTRKIWRKGIEVSRRAWMQRAVRWLGPPGCGRGRGQEGATMVEYAILVSLIAMAAFAIIIILGEQLNAAFTELSRLAAENF